MSTGGGNTLVVHVISARGIQIKGGKPVDVYCSLSTTGKGPWKSKVATNAIRADPSMPMVELRWDEHCEFELNDTDTKLVIHVNHKTIFGTTETLAEMVLHLEQMPRHQPPAWFRLAKSGSSSEAQPGGGNHVVKERGQMQLGFQFSNNLGSRGATSVSNLSLNKIEKENKLNRLRRKMQQQFGRRGTDGGSSAVDTQSLASISIVAAGRRKAQQHHLSTMESRRSSISSTNSGALAFSSPSPNPPIMPDEAGEDFCPSMAEHQGEKEAEGSGKATFWASSARKHHQNAFSTSSETPSFDSGNLHHKNAINNASNHDCGDNANALLRPPSSLNGPSLNFDDGRNSLGGHSSVSGGSLFGGSSAHEKTPQPAPPPPTQQQKLRVKMRQKAGQLFQIRTLTGAGSSSGKKQQTVMTVEEQESVDFSTAGRRDSVASSSGFVSFGSGQLGALNEQTSPEHLLNVIKHLRRELLKKEERIRDMEEYTDHLVTKVMVTNPELLAAPSPKLGARQKAQRRF